MKKLIVSLLMVAGVTAALAQGSVTFNTFNGANTSLGQTFLDDGITAPGPSFHGQLAWSDTSGGTYLAVGSPQPFDAVNRTYIFGPSVIVPAHDAGLTVFIEMWVWDGLSPTYPGAGAMTAFGVSQPKARILAGVDTDGNIFGPSSYNNFANLTLSYIPEPSTIALAGLGVGALLIFRRRK